MAVRFQPFDPAFLQDPYPTYRRLRAESPVHRVRIGPIVLLGLLKRMSQMRREAGAPGLVRTAWQMRRARAQQRAGGHGDLTERGAGRGLGPLRRPFLRFRATLTSPMCCVIRRSSRRARWAGRTRARPAATRHRRMAR